MVKKINGEFDDEYFITSDDVMGGEFDFADSFGNKGFGDLVFSGCGEDTNIRINTSMLVKTNRWKDDAMATVDSADVSSGIIYHLVYEPCF